MWFSVTANLHSLRGTHIVVQQDDSYLEFHRRSQDQPNVLRLDVLRNVTDSPDLSTFSFISFNRVKQTLRPNEYSSNDDSMRIWYRVSGSGPRSSLQLR